MVGGVIDGQAVDAANTDSAFLFKNADDTAFGKIGLNDSDVSLVSGSAVSNSQREFNALWSFLGGLLNQVKTYLPTWLTSNRGTSGDNIFQRISAIDTAFNGTTGHTHDGTTGNGPKISASTLSNVPLAGIVEQGTDYTSTAANSDNVSSLMGSKTASSGITSLGVVVAAPFNKVTLRNSANDTSFEDATGNVVYGRLTHSGSVWTLSYYSEISGVETAYTFLAPAGIRWYYQELFNPMVSTPVYSEFAFIPSDNVTADVIVATTSARGKTQLSSAAASDVSSSGSAGTANATVANADHTHRGVASFAKTGGTLRYGAVSLTQGTNIVITDNGDGTFSLSASGGGGGGSLTWLESANAPTPSVANTGSGVPLEIYSFGAGLSQNLYTVLKIPTSYTGAQIKMKLDFYSSDTANNALLQTVATLIRKNTDSINSIANQRTSTNAAVTLSGGTTNIPQEVVFDLTDSTGKINGVSVSAGDYILVQLTRGTDTTATDLNVPVNGAEVTYV